MSIWSRQEGLAIPPPACTTPCLSANTNNVTLDGCGVFDGICQCRSTTYLQGVNNCLTTQCSNNTEAEIGFQYFNAFCVLIGITPPATVTTPLTQLASSTVSTSSSTVSNGSQTGSLMTLPSNSASFVPEYTASSTPSSNPTSIPQAAPKTTAIVGGVAGGIVAIIFTILLCFYHRRRRNKILRDGYRSKTDSSTIKNARILPHIIISLPPESTPTEATEGPEHHEAMEDSAPPAYQDLEPLRPITPSSTEEPDAANEAAEAHAYEDAITYFCNTNRDLIPPVLEGRLRTAGYSPHDNPNGIPADEWLNMYGVDFFDLKRLQEAYQRSAATTKLLNEKAANSHSSGRPGVSRRPD